VLVLEFGYLFLKPFTMSDDNAKEIGYCVKCKAKSGMDEAERVTMKNGRPAMKGKCETCSTGMYKILPKDAA
jgi:hypothetical protein